MPHWLQRDRSTPAALSAASASSAPRTASATSPRRSKPACRLAGRASRHRAERRDRQSHRTRLEAQRRVFQSSRTTISSSATTRTTSDVLLAAVEVARELVSIRRTSAIPASAVQSDSVSSVDHPRKPPGVGRNPARPRTLRFLPTSPATASRSIRACRSTPSPSRRALVVDHREGAEGVEDGALQELQRRHRLALRRSGARGDRVRDRSLLRATLARPRSAALPAAVTDGPRDVPARRRGSAALVEATSACPATCFDELLVLAPGRTGPPALFRGCRNAGTAARTAIAPTMQKRWRERVDAGAAPRASADVAAGDSTPTSCHRRRVPAARRGGGWRRIQWSLSYGVFHAMRRALVCRTPR